MKPHRYREVRRKLLAAGFVEVGQTGSHVKFASVSVEGTRTAIVSKHGEVAAGTLRISFGKLGSPKLTSNAYNCPC